MAQDDLLDLPRIDLDSTKGSTKGGNPPFEDWVDNLIVAILDDWREIDGDSTASKVQREFIKREPQYIPPGLSHIRKVKNSRRKQDPKPERPWSVSSTSGFGADDIRAIARLGLFFLANHGHRITEREARWATKLRGIYPVDSGDGLLERLARTVTMYAGIERMAEITHRAADYGGLDDLLILHSWGISAEERGITQAAHEAGLVRQYPPGLTTLRMRGLKDRDAQELPWPDHYERGLQLVNWAVPAGLTTAQEYEWMLRAQGRIKKTGNDLTGDDAMEITQKILKSINERRQS